MARIDKSNKTILIVDDDRDIVAALTAILTMENYTPIQAYSGKECFHILKQTPPDLILLDYMLPDMTGKVVVETIRQDEDFSTIPIILISAAHGVEELSKSMVIQDWIEKPFELEQLLRTMRKYL